VSYHLSYFISFYFFFTVRNNNTRNVQNVSECDLYLQIGVEEKKAIKQQRTKQKRIRQDCDATHDVTKCRRVNGNNHHQ
jgi:hypothetical protein